MSGIVIKIKAGATFEESSVSFSGQLVNIIADSERASFGIGSDADLKRAVGKYFGKEPTDAFLHSPTPWYDLYKKYGWSEVERVLEPTKAKILNVTTKPTIVATRTLKNESNEPATFSTKISESVSNTVSTQWLKSGSITLGQMIRYDIGFLGTGAGGQTNVGITGTFGKNTTETKQTTLSSETGVTVQLKPGGSEIVELTASSGTMRVQITYEAYLTGQTAVNYESPYKDHHFHALPIEEVLSGSNKVQITENIELGYHSNATATVKDANKRRK